MSEAPQSTESRSSVGRMSRSAVGRVSGAVSRLFGGASAIQASGRFLRRQLWAWPIIAAVLFGGAGWWVHQSIEHAMREQRATDLNAMVEASVTAVDGYRKEVFAQALAGNTLVSLPYRSTLLLADEKGNLRANLPTMLALGPLRDEKGKPIAALGLRIRPEDQFTRILQVVRFGDSGETFAFDRNGLLLSQSRFDDVMKEIGLLADQPDVRSILTVEVRDPGVNMVEGERPKLRRSEQPLT